MLPSWEMGACLFSKYFKDKCLLHQTQNQGSLKYPSTMDVKYQLWEECQVWLACYILHYSLSFWEDTLGEEKVYSIYIWIITVPAWIGFTLLASFPFSGKIKKIKNCLNILLRLLLFTRTTNSSSLLWQTLASATLQNYGLAAASNLQCVFSAQLIELALIPWFE